MKKKKILIAEDEDSIIELLKIILQDDYNLTVVKDGSSVYNEVCKLNPDLLLLDVMMPNNNGFDICEKLRADKKTKNTNIAILSAKGQERDILNGLKSGADYYITKPFDPDDLIKKVKEIIGD
ncbi:MAG: response regulator transcription factor [Nanobdellota archaeon]